MSDSANVYAAILAGGSGVRMGSPDKPKQFLILGDRPIVAHTVEKFCASGLFEKVVLLCPQAWIPQTKDVLRRYCSQYVDQVDVVAGGAVRNETIMNAVEHIQKAYGADEDTLLVTHDAVRPFVSYRILEENVAAARTWGACDTVVAATDTIVEACDGETISSIPDRSVLYQGQTPQSFKMLHLKELFEGLSSEEKAILTDACKICVLHGESVGLVQGDVSNIKITYPHDLRVARAMLGE